MRCLLSFLLVISAPTFAQVQVNGPMTGPPDLMETAIWLQCTGPCEAAIMYWPENAPDLQVSTTAQTSDASQAHAMTFHVGPLTPGTTYQYAVKIDGAVQAMPEPLRFRTQPIWKHRTDPPPFTFALGSCAYINEPAYDRPGKPYGDSLVIFNSIADKKPDLMIWLGDNIYLREPDWGSRTGFLHRYTHTRATPEMQRLLRGTAHCAIWDDHDFGPNDGDGSFIGSAMSREIFELFWPNPTSGAPGVEGAITSFSYNDVDLFLMDDRTYRVPGDAKTSEPQLLGKQQLDWLINALRYSDASFKLVAVGTQVLNPGAVFENYSTMTKEYAELLRRIDEEGITGVVFLTGDRHFTEMSLLRLADGRKIHDFTCSPLTSGTYAPVEENTLRIPGTYVKRRNFGTLSFAGAKGARTMTVRVFDNEGNQLWERDVQQEKPKKK